MKDSVDSVDRAPDAVDIGHVTLQEIDVSPLARPGDILVAHRLVEDGDLGRALVDQAIHEVRSDEARPPRNEELLACDLHARRS